MRAIAIWLSEKRVVGGLMGLNTSDRRLRNQSASFMTWVAVTYSLLVVDKKTIFCCLEDCNWLLGVIIDCTGISFGTSHDGIRFAMLY